MKLTIFFVASCLSLISACKAKEKIVESPNSKETSASDKTYGKVSHQYSSTGCPTVIITNSFVLDAPHILIPKDNLPKEMDVDGLEISFDYKVLRMPNPEGCVNGIPASIFNILKTR
ncbi:MAG: hypothetical protein H0W84_01580 [Bacteroidetes bacterium]|nr:hypothetical protein [Bacteroidota bacterium]